MSSSFILGTGGGGGLPKVGAAKIGAPNADAGAVAVALVFGGDAGYIDLSELTNSISEIRLSSAVAILVE